jgi:hypothetical protein
MRAGWHNHLKPSIMRRDSPPGGGITMPAAQTHAYIANRILERIRAGIPDGKGNLVVFLPTMPVAAPPADPPPRFPPRRPPPRRPGDPLHPLDIPGRLPPDLRLPGPVVVHPAVPIPAPVTVAIPAATASILLAHPASFCFGASSPDFLPDVITGITTSHQPKNRPLQTLDSFMETFGRSVRWSDAREVSWLLGWFCHLCADVFGHHWVGVEAGKDFLSWLTTPPDVVRLHLGIEMEWAKAIREKNGMRDVLRENILREFGPVPSTPDDAFLGFFFFRRQLVLDAMLTEGAPLAEKFYDIEEAPKPGDEAVQLVVPMIRIRAWRKWHEEQLKKTQKAKQLNDSPLGALADFDLPRVDPAKLAANRIECPLCKAHGTVTQTVERACPTCMGIGLLEDGARSLCLLCGGEGKKRVKCEACEGLPDALRDVCPECHGEKEVNFELCPGCNGAKFAASVAYSLCDTCKGARQVRQELDEKCPFCLGQQYLETALADPAFSSRDLVDAVLRRLIHFHGARIARIDRLSQRYLEAGEKLGLMLLSPDVDMADGQAVQACFAGFLADLADFCTSTLTLSDLAPELAAYDAAVRKGVEDLLALALKFLEFLPVNLLEVYRQLRADLVKAAVDLLAERFKSLLTDPERAKLRAVLDRYPPEGFPPVADAVTLFLLALEGAAPTEAGIAKAFRALGTADNIDGRGQPRLVERFNDAHFPWDGRFRLVKKSGKGEEEDIKLHF